MMFKYTTILASFMLSASLVQASDKKSRASDKSHGPHWAYEGKEGPDQWADISHDFHLCREGHEQSPIDLSWKKPKKNGRDIEFSYSSTAAKVVDNGHTIQVNFASGSKLSLEGKTFDLVQMHFHTHSEHSLSKKFFPLEAHFVHKNGKGELAVVGVFFKVGKSNSALESIWSAIPKKVGEEKLITSHDWTPASLLPSIKTHYHYKGSLTTPPCSEGVNWNVLNTPLEISEKQLGEFQKRYTANYRPVQVLHDRTPANY